MDRSDSLRRELGMTGAVLLGLGSILGTGVFVSLGLGAELAGTGMVLALLLAAALATANGMSSAQLAAEHPVSGGTYEYATRWVHPWAGFLAGWMFLCAKSASAATAALGAAGYVLHLIGVDDAALRSAAGALLVLAVTALCAGGITRSSRANAAIVSVTLAALGALVVVGLLHGSVPGARAATASSWSWTGGSAPAFLHATALLFVAYTGYGRIATLGEEVREPRRVLPRAIGLTLLVSFVLYAGVALVALGTLGAERYGETTRSTAAPLETVAAELGGQPLVALLALGAVTAMVGVLLNLVLGLSRVVLAMARRGDLPPALARVDDGSPRRAVWVVGLAVASLVLLGDVRTTWSFSAVTVLVYYALTNLSALRLPAEHRWLPAGVSAVGLLGCVALGPWIEPRIALLALALTAVGYGVRVASRSLAAR